MASPEFLRNHAKGNPAERGEAVGHMDDDNIPRYTITIRHRRGAIDQEVFNNCTEPDGTEDRLTFTDHNGKQHEFYGADYHIAEQ
jgi:hypothetical protein